MLEFRVKILKEGEKVKILKEGEKATPVRIIDVLFVRLRRQLKKLVPPLSEKLTTSVFPPPS